MSGRGTMQQAWIETPDSGVIELTRDWFGGTPPPLALGRPPRDFKALRGAPPILFSALSGYYVNNRNILHFLLDTARLGDIEWERAGVYLACELSGWGDARRHAKWRMKEIEFAGRRLLDISRRMDDFCQGRHVPFKFITGDGIWIEPPAEAPNIVFDPGGARNLEVDPDRTGRHRFVFETHVPLDLSEDLFVVWRDDPGHQEVPLRPDGFFLRLESSARLGAFVDEGETEFRLFAPRARRVWLQVSERPDDPEPHEYPMERAEDGTWDLRLGSNLSGWFYNYRVAGPSNAFGFFINTHKVADPYARALVSRDGPGIVLEDDFFDGADLAYPTPQWQDLVICEAHVRDLTANAPVRVSEKARRGFRGLAAWARSEAFYLRQLGVNAVELQPVQQFDAATSEEYHWGYMTVNWFAPSSGYGEAPEKASQVEEFRELVRTFHEQDMAVILDVVYNHVGEPAHLLYVDKQYYFETGADGHLENWSGCGNDFRAWTPMGLRMVIDSCIHMMVAYGVDGFRFDLAELIGVETLRKIEAALKRVKPDVILITEPWSFRGHIAGALASTGWASWNDGYRNFLREFVRGDGTRDGIEYYLKGSPWYFARWPAQTVNYTESHDDRTWIDVITENRDGNGFNPTGNDRLRTHLMCAILMMSVGIPMLAEGQDFLRSKHGVNNTYLRGDLNALDYGRLKRFESTHRYFADWISFRVSDRGRLCRLYSRPAEGFFSFTFAKHGTAFAVIYNADGSQGPYRLLFAVNPHIEDVLIRGDEFPVVVWKQVADGERFFAAGETPEQGVLNNGIHLAPLSSGLWISG